MRVQRAEFLAALQFAAVGVDDSGAVEQSETFIFSGDDLISFNDEIFTRSPNPLPGIKAAVIAKDLMTLLERLPDTELEVNLQGDELRLKGRKRTAGITCYQKIKLPIDSVPQPKKFTPLHDDAVTHLRQAAFVAAREGDLGILSNVHAAPDKVEACDSHRLLRITFKTGFPQPVLLSAASLKKITKNRLTGVSLAEGWCWFKDRKFQIGIRSSTEKYRDMGDILKMSGSKKVQFPDGFADIIRRASALADADTRMEIKIQTGKVVLTSRKETGWYREAKTVKYSGDSIEFHIAPNFLLEILEHSPNIRLIPGDKVRITAGPVQFVAVLSAADEEEEVETEEETTEE